MCARFWKGFVYSCQKPFLKCLYKPYIPWRNGILHYHVILHFELALRIRSVYNMPMSYSRGRHAALTHIPVTLVLYRPASFGPSTESNKPCSSRKYIPCGLWLSLLWFLYAGGSACILDAFCSKLLKVIIGSGFQDMEVLLVKGWTLSRSGFDSCLKLLNYLSIYAKEFV